MVIAGPESQAVSAPTHQASGRAGNTGKLQKTSRLERGQVEGSQRCRASVSDYEKGAVKSGVGNESEAVDARKGPQDRSCLGIDHTSGRRVDTAVVELDVDVKPCNRTCY